MLNFYFADSCSSTFEARKPSKRAVETSTEAAPATPVMTLPTTIMTALKETTNDNAFIQGLYQHVEYCVGQFKTDYCLNGGTCFVHKYQDDKIYGCICSSHYHGTRCEEKQLSGSYGGGMKLRIQRSRFRTRRRK